jgi:2-keto-4-pentenoate hydratase
MSVSADVVASFLHTRTARPHWLAIPETHRPRTLEDGYRVQRAVHEALEGRGDKRVGYKVGSTSKPGQLAFGIDEPIYAGIFESSFAPSLAAALAAPLQSPSLECEIAFRLKAGIDGTRPALSREDVAQAVGSCHIACEIVDNRYGDPMAVGVPSLLADDFFHASFVLGDENPDWKKLDLANLDAMIEIDDTPVPGNSAHVMDGLTSLLWLARKLAQAGLALKAGDIIMSGSLVTPTPIKLPAKSVSLAIAGFNRLALAG